MIVADEQYLDLLLAHRPAKPRNATELAELTNLLESLAANEVTQSPSMERFIETLTALIVQHENEVSISPEPSPVKTLRFLMDEHGLRQADLVPLLGSRSYVSQILSGKRPISKQGATRLAARFKVSVSHFLL